MLLVSYVESKFILMCCFSFITTASFISITCNLYARYLSFPRVVSTNDHVEEIPKLISSINCPLLIPPSSHLPFSLLWNIICMTTVVPYCTIHVPLHFLILVSLEFRPPNYRARKLTFDWH
jgi:hypothetical protein